MKQLLLFSLFSIALALASCSDEPAAVPPSKDAGPGDMTSDGAANLDSGVETDSPAPDMGSMVDATSGDLQTSDATPDADASSATESSGIFVWQGFHHEWLRKVAGFRVPHRISRLESYLAGQAVTDGVLTGQFHLGQSTGVDGNYMTPIGRYGALIGPGITTAPASLRVTWTDEADGAEYPQAKSDLERMLVIDLSTEGLADGEADQYAAILRGFKLSTACDDAKQPDGEICNSNGMWPFKMELDVGECARDDTTLSCPITVAIYRAWTPNLGGLPPVEVKPFTHRLDFDLSVFLTIVGGADTALRITRGDPVLGSGQAHDSDPVVTTTETQGAGGFADAVTGLVGFGFEFTRTGTADKRRHLGRYIGLLDFGVEDLGYDVQSGRSTARTTSRVWVPTTVAQTDVNYVVKTALLELGPQAVTASAEEVKGTLCIASDGAPFFSRWDRCGEAETGPERSQDQVAVTFP